MLTESAPRRQGLGLVACTASGEHEEEISKHPNGCTLDFEFYEEQKGTDVTGVVMVSRSTAREVLLPNSCGNTSNIEFL
eukprot:3191706-Pyramimonas_sp.AAC.1